MNIVRLVALTTIAITASVGFNVRGADAADVPIFDVPEEPSGAYVGIFAGWGDGNSVVSNIDPEVDGLVGGALVGWELRRGSFIVGVEGDIAGANIRGVNTAASLTVEVDWLASLRLRAGLGAEGYAIYATGGVALAGVETAISTVTPPSASETLTGYAAGLGIEFALSERSSARVEYMYYLFNPSDFSIGAGTSQTDLELQTVRAALIYNISL